MAALTPQEEKFRQVMQILAIVYTLAGLIFIGLHQYVIGALNLANRVVNALFSAGWHPLNGITDQLWQVMVGGFMLTLALLAWSCSLNVKTNHIFVIPILFAQLIGALLYLLVFFVSPAASFGHLFAAIVDVAIFGVVIWTYGRTDLDEQFLGIIERVPQTGSLMNEPGTPGGSEPTAQG